MSSPTILLAAPDRTLTEALRGLLHAADAGDVITSTDTHLVRERARAGQVDLVLVDLDSPLPNGYAVIEDLVAVAPHDEFLPIVAVTRDPTGSALARAVMLGAAECLPRPLNPAATVRRIRDLLHFRQQYAACMAAAAEDVLESFTRLMDLDRADDPAPCRAAEAELGAELAGVLGLPATDCAWIGAAILLRDLGLAAIPLAARRHPERLQPETALGFTQHTRAGARLLSARRDAPLRIAARVARSHHEHWDGTGYPDSLRGEAIPIEARIAAVVATYCDRSAPRTSGDPMLHLRQGAGLAYDPRVVQALSALVAVGAP